MDDARELRFSVLKTCLLYTSDAADERSSVDLGGRRIIKKKKEETNTRVLNLHRTKNDKKRDEYEADRE